MAPRTHSVAWTLAVLLLAPALVGAAPTLRYEGGGTLSDRQAAAELRPAVRQPGDSLALDRALESLLARYQAAGHLDARVAAAGWCGETLAVHVAPGPRYRWGELRVEAAGAADSALVATLIGLRPGQPADPPALGEALQRALGGLEARGHPYAQLGVRSLTWQDGVARAVVTAVPGPQVTVTAVRFEGLRATRPELVRRTVGRLVGLPYDPAAAEAARGRLEDLGLFRRVELLPLEGETDWSRAHVIYRLEERTYSTFEGALGFQGEGRRVGLAHLGLENLAGTGRALDLRWEGRGEGVADFAARFGEPWLLGTRLRLELMLLQNVQDTLYTRTRWGARLRFPLGAGQGADAGYEQERVVADVGEVEEANLQTTRFGLERDGRDDRLAPRRGLRLRLEGAQTFKRERLRPLARRTANASTLEGQGEWHLPLGLRGGLSYQWTVSARFSSQRVLPFFERFPVGGAASLRGYREEQFRADRAAVLRSEASLFAGPGGQRVFAFFDQAWMETRLAEPAGRERLERLWKPGIGVGMRLDSRAGRVGVDYGLEPGRPPLEGKLHLRLESRF
jgi:outer membrane protein assembly factor BamA